MAICWIAAGWCAPLNAVDVAHAALGLEFQSAIDVVAAGPDRLARLDFLVGADYSLMQIPWSDVLLEINGGGVFGRQFRGGFVYAGTVGVNILNLSLGYTPNAPLSLPALHGLIIKKPLIASYSFQEEAITPDMWEIDLLLYKSIAEGRKSWMGIGSRFSLGRTPAPSRAWVNSIYLFIRYF